MLSVDFRRAFTTPLFYLMTGIAFAIPILVLVMTTAMAGTTTVDPTTGVETTIEGFTSVWQAIAATSDVGAGMSMDLTSMCNINMLYFLAAVFVCIFVADDFRSGYAKNLFAVRAKKTEYVFSKTLVGFVGGACMIVVYFIGTLLGGAIAGLPFDTGTAGADGIAMCLLSKIFLMAVFVAIYLLMSVVAKQRLWLSILGALGVGMLLFNIAPITSPLDSTIVHVVLCVAGGALFAVGFGAISNLILKKTNLV